MKLKLSGLQVPEAGKSEILQMIDELSVSSREIAHDLQSLALHGNDLAQIIDLHLSRLNEEQDIRFQFVQSGTPRSLPPEMEFSVYRILMELIANILRHSKATEALVQFIFQEDCFELLVEDNGIGIDKDVRQGIGTQSIRKRAAELRGILHVDTRPGNTTYIINIPYPS
jgi:signal transduction histidine kinase